MTSVALALSLAAQQAPPAPAPWRLVSTPTLHVGLRPALLVDGDGDPVEVGLGATLQVTADWW